jgi:hypothetical protein
MTHKNPASTEAIEERQKLAANILEEHKHWMQVATDESERWKQRHADLTISTMWIVGVLMLVIAGLVWTCMLLMREGCK